jgi:hypothetical protein
VVDTSMFDEDGGPSLAERAMKVKRKGKKLRLRRPTRSACRAGTRCAIGCAAITGRSTRRRCSSSRALPGRDPHARRASARRRRVEIRGRDTEGEDHPPDGIRYGCMSRPRKIPEPADDRGLEGPEDPGQSKYRMD